MPYTIAERLELHRQYWKGMEMKKLPVSFRLGDYFFADKFKAALPLLKPGPKIEPSQMEVDAFLPDYERMYHEIEETGQDGFWSAEPFTAIPWMEAILGCPVFGGGHSFFTEPCIENDITVFCESILDNNPWYEKYTEFTRKLVQLSNGRFPVAQPILRGPSDVAGALLGQTRLIYEMNDNPEAVIALLTSITRIFKKIVAGEFEQIPDFCGGTAIGFYHIWTPGKCIWFQEDLTSLLSPAWYRQFVLECDTEICEGYDYSAIHVHPSSFHILDDILTIQKLSAVEINKDVGGPTVAEMVPVLKKVLCAGKQLILWGALDARDIEVVIRELPSSGVFLNIVAENVEKAKELMKLIDKAVKPFDLV